jgi:signal transduction histidine kinase
VAAPAAVPPRIVARSAAGRPFRVLEQRLTVGGRPYAVTVATPTGPADDAIRRFGLLLLGLTPAVLLLAGVGGYWISARALAPVDRMTQAAAAITLRSLDRRLDVPRPDDELRRLAVTFNDMLARLRTAVADVVQFTADASHELRTPVSFVRATAEIALDRPRPAEDYRRALAEVLGEAERMSTLVDDLLALARTDAGVDGLEPATIDMRRVIASARDLTAPGAARKGVALDVALPADAIAVRGHERSLVRLLRAVLDNAVKYTPPGGTVWVGLSVPDAAGQPAAWAVVRVTDAGPGVDAADAPRIFDRFYRGRDARSRALEGSGLGLSLAQAIAQRAGGGIVLVATPDKPGATFEIRLPQAR